MAGGVSSTYRKSQRPTPLFFREGHGSHAWDVDGNEYIDFVLAYGPLVLGHGHPAVVGAAQAQLEQGQTFGAQTELECRLGEKLLQLLRWPERVAYVTTGSEAVHLALRLARAHTGRSKVIRFTGHYHGWFDGILVQPPEGDPFGAPRPVSGGQSLRAQEEVLCLPWNDPAVLEEAFTRYPGEIAAIIMEPFLGNGGGVMPRRGYLAEAKQLCQQHGALLIFDEVITGFRVALGGAAELFDVTPDLGVYGKAVAGGLPLALVAGRASVMDLIDDGRVFHAGTFNGNPVALAAALATLEQIEKNGGDAMARIRRLGERLQDHIRSACAAAGQKAHVQGLGSVFWVYFDETVAGSDQPLARYDGRRYADFAEKLLDEGVLVMPSGRWYVSAAHTEEDLSATVLAVERALAKLSAPQDRQAGNEQG